MTEPSCIKNSSQKEESQKDAAPETTTTTASATTSLTSENLTLMPPSDTQEIARQHPSRRDVDEPTETNTHSNNSNTNSVVYVSHLPARYGTEAIIEKMMQKYGTIVRIHACSTRKNQRHATSSSGNSTPSYWFVEFASAQQANLAIAQLHGRKFAGQSIVVQPAHQQQQQNKQSLVAPSSSGSSKHNSATTKTQIHRLESQIRAIQKKLKTDK